MNTKELDRENDKAQARAASAYFAELRSAVGQSQGEAGKGCENSAKELHIDASITGIVNRIAKQSQVAAEAQSRRGDAAGELAYLLQKNPDVARIIDLRKELGL